jgi:integral membrane sensor domain MASE1
MNEEPAGQEGRPPAGGTRRAGYLLLVLAYVATGKLGLMLALAGGYVSPIFPPAGIAVAAVLIAGTGASPWVFLGALLLNLWTGYSATHQIDLTGVAAAAIIAVASTAQARLGGGWLRRLIGYPTALDNGADLARFLFATPVICITSATLSVAGLWAVGVLGADQLAASWTAWWIGDTLGVLVMLPATLAVAGEPRRLWRSRIRTVALPTGLAFALLVVVFVAVTRWSARIRCSSSASCPSRWIARSRQNSRSRRPCWSS